MAGKLITENPYLMHLGVELLKMENGEAQVGIWLRPEHGNSWAVMHGGVIMTLLDCTMSRAARSLVLPDITSAATVEMKTSFFQPGGKVGQYVTAIGRVLHRSTTLYYCEAEIRNGETLAAKAMGTFKVFKRSDIAKRMQQTTAPYLNK